jgi:hypothetical protein
VPRLGRRQPFPPIIKRMRFWDYLIAFDAATASAFVTAASTISWSHTCTGADRYLTVGVALFAGVSVSTLTYNSVSMALIRAEELSGVRAEIWGLVAPDTGSHTVLATLSGSGAGVGGAVSFTGVNQTSPYEAANGSTGENVDQEVVVTVTTVANWDWVVDVIASDDTAITVGSGQTQRINVSGAPGSGAMSTEGPKSPAGAVEMGWLSAVGTYANVGVALRPVVAGALGEKVPYNPWMQLAPILSM